MTKDIVATPCC